MSFQSYEFLFVFLPVTFAGWWLLNWRGYGKLAQIFLLGASLFFYGLGGLAFLPLLAGLLLFWSVISLTGVSQFIYSNF